MMVDRRAFLLAGAALPSAARAQGVEFDVNILDIAGSLSALRSSSDITEIIEESFWLTSQRLDAGEALTARVCLPAGRFSLVRELKINDPRIALVGEGSRATALVKIGSGRGLHYRPERFDARTPGFAGGISGLSIFGTGEPAQILCEYGDVVGMRFFDFTVSGASGEGSVGLWGRNLNGWTERTDMSHVHVDYCSTGHVLSAATRKPGTKSFGYSQYSSLFFNVDSGQIGWLLDETGPNFYHSIINVVANVHGSGELLRMRSGARIADCSGQILGENNQATAGRGIVQDHGSVFHLAGNVNLAELENVNANIDKRVPSFMVSNGQAPVHSPHRDAAGLGFRKLNSKVCSVSFSSVDSLKDPYAGLGFMIGKERRSPFISMYGRPGNELSILAPAFEESVSEARKVGAITSDGDFKVGRSLAFGFNNNPLQSGLHAEVLVVNPGEHRSTTVRRVVGGLLLLRDMSTGGSALYLADEAGEFVEKVSGAEKFVSGLPTQGAIGLTCNSEATTLHNGTDNTLQLSVFQISGQWAEV